MEQESDSDGIDTDPSDYSDLDYSSEHSSSSNTNTITSTLQQQKLPSLQPKSLDTIYCHQCNRNIHLKDYQSHLSMHELLRSLNSSTPTSTNNNAQIQSIKIEAITSFSCKHCNQSFDQQSYLQRHIINKHTPNHLKPFHCRYCPQGAAKKGTIRKHEANHLKTEKLPFRCKYCSFSAQNHAVLSRHESVHFEQGIQPKQESDDNSDEPVQKRRYNLKKRKCTETKFKRSDLQNQSLDEFFFDL